MNLRTQKEIIDYCILHHNDDFLGVICADALCYLDYDHAKEFLKPECTKEEWGKDVVEYSVEAIKKQMINYMPFAWEKAINERGLSAIRSLQHYQFAFWLIGENEISEHIFTDYCEYGKPKLREIQKYLGLDENLFKE